jgi:hypothetical protein
VLMVMSGLVMVWVVLFVIRQTTHIVTVAAMVHPLLGYPALALLLFLSGVGLGLPVVLYLRLLPPLRWPADSSAEAITQYLQRLVERLSQNPALKVTASHPAAAMSGQVTAGGRAATEVCVVILEELRHRTLSLKTPKTLLFSHPAAQNNTKFPFHILWEIKYLPCLQVDEQLRRGKMGGKSLALKLEFSGIQNDRSKLSVLRLSHQCVVLSGTGTAAATTLRCAKSGESFLCGLRATYGDRSSLV